MNAVLSGNASGCSKHASLRRGSTVDEEKLRSRIQVLAQFTGVLVVFIYAGGFLALSLHHASFGISQFNLLRPKIISAGVLFLILAALPAIETMQIVEPDVAEVKKSVTPNSAGPGKSTEHWTRQFGLLLSVIICSSGILRPFLADSVLPHFYQWGVVAILPSLAVITAIPFLLNRGRTWELAFCYSLFVMIVLWSAFCVYQTRAFP